MVNHVLNDYDGMNWFEWSFSRAAAFKDKCSKALAAQRMQGNLLEERILMEHHLKHQQLALTCRRPDWHVPLYEDWKELKK